MCTVQSVHIRITSECGRSSKSKQTCDHTWRALTALRFYPHLQGEITARNLHARLKPQLVSSAAEVNTVAAERRARAFSRLTETRVQAARAPLRCGQGALAPRQPRAARFGRDSARLPRAHQVTRPAHPPHGAALAAETQAEHQEARQPSAKSQKFHFHVERNVTYLGVYLYIYIYFEFSLIDKVNTGLSRNNAFPLLFRRFVFFRLTKACQDCGSKQRESDAVLFFSFIVLSHDPPFPCPFQRHFSTDWRGGMLIHPSAPPSKLNGAH